LDRVGAVHARVIQHDRGVALVWMDSTDQWQSLMYRNEKELETLPTQAKLQREAMLQGGRDSWEERFRTLGQELDREGIRLIKVSAHGAIHVTGFVADTALSHTYSADELQKLNSDRRAGRKVPTPLPWWKQLFTSP